MSSGQMEGVKILLVLCIMIDSCYGWANSFDGYLNFQCPTGQQIVTLSSYHNDYYEDRRWNYLCETYAPLGSCTWHNKVNSYDQTMNFKCPGNGAICGFRATHNNYYEDRIYDVKCCTMSQLYPTGLSCDWSGKVNSYDNTFYYGVPWHKYIHGIYSTHSNFENDRVFEIYECKRWIW
ncbi:hypothetical protein SNE40_000577 [Patella caerulea]|uniref:Dermatopontin n=1 Tax=Patella caerulea TaxID=87958 RepID=A0AAN8Q2E5_PATCE